MKRMISLVVGALVMGTMAFGQVYSQNAVGYIKRSVNANEFVMIQTPFVNIDGSDHTIESLFGDSLPIGTTVFIWNGALQTYDSVQQLAAGFWNPQNVTIARGQAMFMRPTAATDVFLLGEVPGTGTFASTDIPLVEGFNGIGNPYPTAITLEDSGLEAVTAIGDIAFLWNQTAQTYDSVQKLAAGFWNPPGTVIEPGDGIFLSFATAGGATYTETPSYDWPTN